MSELGPYEKMTNQEKREFFRNRETEAAMKPTLGTECSKCGHVHMSIVCSCGCDISGELLKPQAKMSQPENELRAALERMRDEAKHEEKVAKEHDDLGQHSWGFKRTAEALRRWTLVLETALASRACATSEYERGRRDGLTGEVVLQIAKTLGMHGTPLLCFIPKKLDELAEKLNEAIAATSGTPAPATTPTDPIEDKYERICDFCGAGYTGRDHECPAQPQATIPLPETGSTSVNYSAQAAAPGGKELLPEDDEAFLEHDAMPSHPLQDKLPGPRCSHGVLMREFCQGCEDAAPEESK